VAPPALRRSTMQLIGRLSHATVGLLGSRKRSSWLRLDTSQASTRYGIANTIGNRQYLAYGLNQNDPDTGALGFDYALVGEPRTYGVDLTYRF
jgi:hypothetical protein